MSRYLCPLDIRLMADEKGIPMENRWGRQLWELLSAFGYFSKVAGDMTIIVPTGFVTDLASVPRLPVIYTSLGDMAQMPAVIHDYLYSTRIVSRKIADQVLLEAMEITGVSWIKRKLIYAGVRVGGGNAYNSD